MSDGAKSADGSGALDGLRILDCGVLFAGPLIATMFADFGADVIKVEHPRGDSLRTLGWRKDGESLWWAHVNRNKRCVTCNLSKPEGAELLKEMISTADVLIESFRVGRMERWGLGYEALAEINPGLVMVRVTGFGQSGPYAPRPGFGTVAEAMSGFAYSNGFPDRPPALPSFALGDGIAALYGTIATMAALRHRDDVSGRGQMVDLSLVEPLFSFLGPQALVYDQLGMVQERLGNSTTWTSPRNTYLTSDGRWVAISASSQKIAERLIALVGRGDLAAEPWFADHAGRSEHAEELDREIGRWIGERTQEEVLAAFEQAEAAVGPVYSIADIFEDPQFRARGMIVDAEHPVLGAVKVPQVVPYLSETPGSIRGLGAGIGEDNHVVYRDELGHDEEEMKAWKREGTI